MGLKLFVLTTRSIYWFQERGFTLALGILPSKKTLYNYQGRPKILRANLEKQDNR